MRSKLASCATIEIAAARAKIPQKALLVWIELGMRGLPEYTPFTDMIEEEYVNLSEGIIKHFYEKAFVERDTGAMKFLYENRIKKHEERFQKKLEALQDKLDAEVAASSHTAPEEDLAEAEKRAEEAADAAMRH